jgi:hypothetical protein
MKTEWITSSNKRILFADFSGLLAPDMINLTNRLFQEVEKSPNKVTILSNYHNTNISARFVEVNTEWVKKLKVKTDRYAVYGLNTPKRIMLNAFNSVTKMGIKAFETREEALEYLTRL